MAYGRYGHTTLGIASAALLVPTATLLGASSVMIQNLDTGGPVYWGYDSSVTTATGSYIPAMASGVPGSVTIPLPTRAGVLVTIYGISAGGQTAPADTRYSVSPDHP